MTRKILAAANWKMNGSRTANRAWTDSFVHRSAELACDILVCAPSVYLSDLGRAFEGSKVMLGAQDVNEHANGAYTGETAAAMLKDVGCEWVIIGHSERRTLYGDSNERVAAKCRAAHEQGLRVVLCVGETLQEREAGTTIDVVTEQLQAALNAIGPQALAAGALAYEPVWAIGTGKTATPAQAQEVHAALRDAVRAVDPESADALRILYGGSVKPANAAELFAMPDIDGALVGGAALKAEDFYSICASAQV
jgi:triosephosphate isomerase